MTIEFGFSQFEHTTQDVLTIGEFLEHNNGSIADSMIGFNDVIKPIDQDWALWLRLFEQVKDAGGAVNFLTQLANLSSVTKTITQ